MTLNLKDIKFTDLLDGDPQPGQDGDNDDAGTGDDTGTGKETGKNLGDDAGDDAGDSADDDANNGTTGAEDAEDAEDGSNPGDDQAADDQAGVAGDEKPLITSVAEQIGYKLEEGEEYPDSEEGLVKFIPKVAEKLAGEQLLEFFQQFPKVEEFARYCANGGDPDKYFETASGTGVEKLTLTEEDEVSQKAVLNKFLEKQGYETAEIDEIIADYSNTGLLFKQAQKAQTKLAKIVETEHQKAIESQQKVKDREVAEQKKLWSQIESTVTTGTIKGIQIPENEKKKFFDWMAKPADKQGRSQRDIQRESMDVETMIALEYLLYKNFDLGNLIKVKANSLNAKTLKERLGGSSSGKKLSGTGSQALKKPPRLPDVKELF